jgi:uncharacterized damage-inducible protein DinB
MDNELINRFEAQWRFARGLTKDLLRSLEPEELAFTPSKHLGPFWKHFRHLGRVQENYLQAIETGRVVFGFDNTTYRDNASRQPLVDYLDRVDQRLTATLTNLDTRRRVDWFGSSVDAYTHFTRMADHELLHHGMFVVYVHLLGRPFPRSWAAWGL